MNHHVSTTALVFCIVYRARIWLESYQSATVCDAHAVVFFCLLSIRLIGNVSAGSQSNSLLLSAVLLHFSGLVGLGVKSSQYFGRVQSGLIHKDAASKLKPTFECDPRMTPWCNGRAEARSSKAQCWLAPPPDVKGHVTASVLCSQGSEEEAEDRLAVSRLVTMLKEGRSSGGSSDNDKQE